MVIAVPSDQCMSRMWKVTDLPSAAYSILSAMPVSRSSFISPLEPSKVNIGDQSDWAMEELWVAILPAMPMGRIQFGVALGGSA